MFVRSSLAFCLCCFGALALGQDSSLEFDFMSSYYDQDGENSPVNGGRGSEELQSISPVIAITYTKSSWVLRTDLGLDNVTSASIDAMDDNAGPNNPNVSSASRKDNRAFAQFNATKKLGPQSLGGSLGFSKEYDYSSLHGGLAWSRDFNQNNTTLAVNLHHYADQIDLYNIHGVNVDQDDRSTTDVSIVLSQVMTRKTVASAEFYLSDQSGFLSSPFQEVILQDGSHVAERLPGDRQRMALRFLVNHAFSDRVVTRFSYRIYDDDFEIQAHTLEVEPHFRLAKAWLYPILRWHHQDGSPYFGAPQSFQASDPYYTADRDLSSFDSTKIGLGIRFDLGGQRIKSWDARANYYDRDDGLSAFIVSFGLRWSLW